MIERVRRARAWCAWLSLVLVLLAGCSRDPNVKKRKYLESGQRYAAQGKYSEAALQFQNALQVDSGYYEAHYALAQVYLNIGSFQGAVHELMRATQSQPGNAQAQLELANLFMTGHAVNRAQERVSLVLDKDPNNVDAHLLQANIYGLSGDLAKSASEAQLAIRLDPKRAEAYVVLAQVDIESNQNAEAEAELKKAISIDPKFLSAIMFLGDFYQNLGRDADAEQQYRAAIAARPSALFPRATLARFFLTHGKMDSAVAVLADARKDLPDDPNAYRMLPIFYLATGQIDKAIAELQPLMAQHPKDVKLKKNYVEALIVSNRLPEAMTLDQKILDSNPKDLEALTYRGQILNRQGRYREAIPDLERVVKAEADNGIAHYHLGVAYVGAGDSARAETEWREVVRLKPQMMEAQQALAAVALNKGDVDLLRQSAEKLIELQPTSPAGYVLRSYVFFAHRDGPRGEADLRKAMELAPNHPLPYTRLGQWRLTNNREADAAKLFEHALELEPRFEEALRGLVTIDMRQRQPAKAIARVQAQIAKVPDTGSFYYLLATLYLSGGNTAGAESALQKAIDLNKNDVESLLLLGQIQSSQSRVDAAIHSYEQTIVTNPRDVRAYVLLGTLLEGKGDWQKAQDLYKKALEIEPDYPPAANNMAFLMMERGGNVDAAASLAQVARRKMPDSPAVADTLAWAYYHKGVYGLAVDLLLEAAKKDPQSSNYQYHLGVVYQKMGNGAEAKTHYERALQMDPKNAARNAEIRKALAEIAKG